MWTWIHTERRVIPAPFESALWMRVRSIIRGLGAAGEEGETASFSRKERVLKSWKSSRDPPKTIQIRVQAYNDINNLLISSFIASIPLLRPIQLGEKACKTGAEAWSLRLPYLRPTTSQRCIYIIINNTVIFFSKVVADYITFYCFAETVF